MKVYVFKDAQGEELGVEANSPVESWEILSRHFGTDINELKELGVRRIPSVSKNIEIINQEVA